MLLVLSPGIIFVLIPENPLRVLHYYIFTLPYALNSTRQDMKACVISENLLCWTLKSICSAIPAVFFQAPQCCGLYTISSVNWSHRRQSRSSVWARDPEQTSRSGWRRSWSPRNAVVSTIVGLVYSEQKAKAKATSLLEFLFGNVMCCSYWMVAIIQRKSLSHVWFTVKTITMRKI